MRRVGRPRRARRARARPRAPDGPARVPGSRDRVRGAAAGRDRGVEARGGQARPRRPAARAGLGGRACARGRGRSGRCAGGGVRRAPGGRARSTRGRRARGAGVRAERRGHRAGGGGSHLPRTTRARPRAAGRGPRTDRRARRAPAQVRDGARRRCSRSSLARPRAWTRSPASSRRGSGPRLEVVRTDRAVSALATAVSDGRDRATPQLTTALQEELGELGMEGASIEVTLVPNAELAPTGAEHAEFVFSGGPSQPAQPLAKVASGGELSQDDARVPERAGRPGRRTDADLRRGGRGDRRTGRGRRRAAPREPRARPSGRRRDPPAADRLVRRPAHPGPQGRRDRLGRGAGRRGSGGGALADAGRSCPGAMRRPPTPRSCCPRPGAAGNGPPSTARRSRSPGRRQLRLRYAFPREGRPRRFTGSGLGRTLARAQDRARRRPRSGRNRGACSGGRFGDRSRRPASLAWTRGPSGWFSACSRGRSR